VLKHKPEIGKVNLGNHYKSMGCVLKGKAGQVVRIELSNFGSLLVSRGQLLHGGVTGRMQKIAGEHSKDITAVLQTMVRDGLLTQQNQRRWASYRVAEDSPNPATTPLIWTGTPPKAPPNWAQTPPNCHRTPPNWNVWSGFRPRFWTCYHWRSPPARTRNFRWTNSKMSFSGCVKAGGWQLLNWQRW
jgi:hypothetical protein